MKFATNVATLCLLLPAWPCEARGIRGRRKLSEPNKSCGSKSKNQADYRGTIAETKSGLKCQPWADQTPHEHTRTKANYPDAGLEKNYCRNPDGESGAWCYTMSDEEEKRWELCEIPECSEELERSTAPEKEESTADSEDASTALEEEEFTPDSEDTSTVPEEEESTADSKERSTAMEQEEFTADSEDTSTIPEVEESTAESEERAQEEEESPAESTIVGGYGYSCPSTKDSSCSGDLICGRKTASSEDADNYICCNGFTFGFYDYCSGLGIGEECLSNGFCASGYCDGFMGFTVSGKCAEPRADGQSCLHDAECKSTHCSFNGFGPAGKCLSWTGSKQAGESCPTTKDDDCSGDLICGRKTASDDDADNYICCDGGTWLAKDYCYQMEDGSSCWTDQMCKSGHCSGNVGGTQRGYCSTPGTIKEGESCPSTRDSDCVGDLMCGRKDLFKQDYICCKGQTINSVGYGLDYSDVCNGQPDGSWCRNDEMCESGFCFKEFKLDLIELASDLGKCTSVKQEGEGCGTTRDGECSGELICGRKTASDDDEDNYICCDGGTHLARDYCYGLEDGASCWTDEMCTNGICSGNLGGLQRGTCSNCRADGVPCLQGTTCDQCCNEARDALGTKCGGEKWSDGTICAMGTTCNFCENKATHWDGKGITACGSEPCWADGTVCLPGTTCDQCCNEARDALGTKCGGEKWSDGTICGGGTTCEFCENEATYWNRKAMTACGSEPCWPDGTECLEGTTCDMCCNEARDALGTKCGGKKWSDGTVCALGTTCNFCENEATYWNGKAMTACGSEPCWPDGTTCGAGTTCNQCCNEARQAAGTKCGGEKWSDGARCGLGTTCNLCENGATYWNSKAMTACGSEPCWGPGTICGLGTTCNNCCNGAHWYSQCK